MKSTARAVVIGGGVVGVSTLYHLARLGLTDAMLLERNELTSGSTWHAAGLLPLFNLSYSVGKLHQYSVDLYPRLEAETGLNVGFSRVSNIRLATTADRLDEYRYYAGVARTIGVEVNFLTPDQVREIWPLCNTEGVLGAIQHPADGYIQPADLTQALARQLSFTGGASALSVSQSAMSRHVGMLEDLLGKQLFEREFGKLVLTPAGEELLAVVGKAFERIERTLNAIRDEGQPQRAMRLHVPPTLLQQLFMPALADFHRAHPQIRIDVSSANVTGLPETDPDMAIVYDRPHVDDRVTDLLWMVRVAPLCSPQTAARAPGKPLEQFLAEEELLHLKLDDRPRDLLWGDYLQRCGAGLSTAGGLAFDTAIAAARYAMTSGGVMLGDVDLFADELAQGLLVMPYDAVIEDGYGYYLKLHADDLADPAIAAFRSWLIGRFGEMRTRID